ncbi:MAG TPA: hypothetical protein VFZ65_21925, partial [Planctomycetota bacterium]|nr:hypothetical protein [Planctomycetota bacterium]
MLLRASAGAGEDAGRTIGGGRRRRLLMAGLTLALAAVFVRLAWLGDDAYITLRCVENWVSGNGLRWNTMDRVQTYTHPLWMLLLAMGRLCCGELYFTTIGIGLLLSLLAVPALLRFGATAASWVATAVLLVSARAFGEYATSGLETPLTYVLLAWFCTIVAREHEPRRRFDR